MVAIIQPRKCSSRFVDKRAKHAFESLALKVGDVVVQLVSQRFQGPRWSRARSQRLPHSERMIGA